MPKRKTVAAPAHDLMVLPQDQVVPVRPDVFGLASRRGDSIAIYDGGDHGSLGNNVVILWADKKRRPTFGSWLQLQIGKTKRRIQIRTSDPNAKEDNKERWFSLGPKDIVAREIGTLCLSDKRLPRGVREGWPQRYQATGIGRMKSKQTFAIETPKGSPWPGWTHLFVDPMAGIGPNSYVVAIPGAAMTSNAFARGKQILGPQ
jgi:hypothetical protein